MKTHVDLGIRPANTDIYDNRIRCGNCADWITPAQLGEYCPDDHHLPPENANGILMAHVMNRIEQRTLNGEPQPWDVDATQRPPTKHRD